MSSGDNQVVTCFLDENCFSGLFDGFAGSSGLAGRRGLEDDGILCRLISQDCGSGLWSSSRLSGFGMAGQGVEKILVKL